MAYDNEGRYYFAPELDEEDQESLGRIDRDDQARLHRDRQAFAQHQHGAFTSGIEKALNEFGISPADFERLAASNPHATAAVNSTSGYMTAKSVIQGAMGEAGRPRDSAGRFVSGPRAGKKPRKSAAEFRAHVKEHGRITGDDQEQAVAVLDALLS